MKRLKALTLLLACCAAPTAKADIVIDSFSQQFDSASSGGAMVVAPVSGPFTDSSSQTGLSSVLGGERTASLSLHDTTDEGAGATATIPTTNYFSVDEGVNGASTVGLIYGDSGSPLGANLSGLNYFVLNFIAPTDFNATTNPVDWTLRVTSNLLGADQVQSASVTMTDPSAASYALPFSAFPGIDFTHVDQLSLTLNATGNGSPDYSMTSFTASAVPEPSSFWLAVVAIAGMLAALQRRRHRQRLGLL